MTLDDFKKLSRPKRRTYTKKDCEQYGKQVDAYVKRRLKELQKGESNGNPTQPASAA